MEIDGTLILDLITVKNFNGFGMEICEFFVFPKLTIREWKFNKDLVTGDVHSGAGALGARTI